MKLPADGITFEQKLREFDVWATPFLSLIRDSAQYANAMGQVVRTFDRLALATEDFKSEASCDHKKIADTFVHLTSAVSDEEAYAILMDLAQVLFLVTGKSDNNTKCQLAFDLHMRQKRSTWPVMKRVRVKKTVTESLGEEPLPRVLKAEDFMRRVVSLKGYPASARELLDLYIGFVLSDQDSLDQLWGLGRSYATLKQVGMGDVLFRPIVIFQVRGSVAATGGHEPEQILREQMLQWGLLESVDFNPTDVEVAAHLGIPKVTGPNAEKTRAYDFAIPFRAAGWAPKILIQSQFYAGDSGSVSHKNVEQAENARAKAKGRLGADTRFVEFVDGAGYFASLNKDFRHLISFADTATFIQVRTAPIRLRREFQIIGFLTPLELEHAILRTDGSTKATTALLVSEGYAAKEVDRCLGAAITAGIIGREGPQLEISPERRPTARRYLLLDLAAIHGPSLADADGAAPGLFLVPGYGAFHGLPVAELRAKAEATAPPLAADWAATGVFEADMLWLTDRGYAIVNP